MININIFHNKDKDIYKFTLSGHAEYAENGSDIVCSAVSVLVLNTINCIEDFTNEDFKCNADKKDGGFIEYLLPEIRDGRRSHDAQLLLKTMVRGLNDIKKEYSHYIKINDKEV